MQVLVVCTGNICRSPALERMLRSTSLADHGVDIVSAGTDAMVGAPIHPEVSPLLVARGLDVDGFEARLLREPMAREADLVLTMTRDHRSKVAALAPAAVRRTYTISELARIAERIESADTLGATPEERLETLIVHAPALRTPAAALEDDDIADPIGGPPRAYETAVLELERQVTALRRVLD